MRRFTILMASQLSLWSPAASAQWAPPGTALVPPSLPAVGSRNVVVTVAPRVPRPTTRSCVVPVLPRREFVGADLHPVDYAPPADCPGPWARIVLESDFDVTAGRQYDRTARLSLAGVPLFTGTTMEPRADLAPKWHVERDLTEYAALFAKPATGTAFLENYVDAKHDGRVFWQARLIFYPAGGGSPAPAVPDLVVPMAPAVAKLTEKDRVLARTVTWPRNLTRLALDVLVMPQSGDESWQRCLPADAMPKDLKGESLCGYPFRESEIRIDGQLAGFAPVYPWIYTGAMGVWNWTLIPGIGTLDLQPYRVDLTPFAALMNDGKPHRIELTARGAKDYMAATGVLLAWQDGKRRIVTGKLTRNTLTASSPTLSGDFDTSRASGGSIDVAAARTGGVTGYIDGSRGRVTTRIDQTMRFENRLWPRGMTDDARQVTAIDTQTVTVANGRTRRSRVSERYPLAWGRAIDPGSTRRDGSDLDQEFIRDETVSEGGLQARRQTRQIVSPRSVSVTRNGVRKEQVNSTVSIRVRDSRAGCYGRTVTVTDRTVTENIDTCA